MTFIDIVVNNASSKLFSLVLLKVKIVCCKERKMRLSRKSGTGMFWLKISYGFHHIKFRKKLPSNLYFLEKPQIAEKTKTRTLHPRGT